MTLPTYIYLTALFFHFLPIIVCVTFSPQNQKKKIVSRRKFVVFIFQEKQLLKNENGQRMERKLQASSSSSSFYLLGAVGFRLVISGEFFPALGFQLSSSQQEIPIIVWLFKKRTRNKSIIKQKTWSF